MPSKNTNVIVDMPQARAKPQNRAPTAPATPPAARRALDQLREMIVRGELAPGDRIVERTLSARFQVSRTPMREALKLLETDGLIELSQNRGARVLAFTEREAVELFEVLSGLESLAAELATERMTRSGRANLEKLHAEMSSHYQAQELDAYFAVNTKIHETVVAMASNDFLDATYRRLILRAKRGRYMAVLNADRWRQAMDEHDELIEAMGRRNAADAGRVWRAHLAHTGKTVAAVLRAISEERAAS